MIAAMSLHPRLCTSGAAVESPRVYQYVCAYSVPCAPNEAGEKTGAGSVLVRGKEAGGDPPSQAN